MNTDTPRIIAFLKGSFHHRDDELEKLYCFGEQLERELNAANAEIERLKNKPCDFCNESPQTENEKAYYEKYGNAPPDQVPSVDEWRREISIINPPSNNPVEIQGAS